MHKIRCATLKKLANKESEASAPNKGSKRSYGEAKAIGSKYEMLIFIIGYFSPEQDKAKAIGSEYVRFYGIGVLAPES